MKTWGFQRSSDVDPKKSDRLDRMAQLAQIVMAIVAIIALFQDKTVWFIIFLLAFLLMSLAFFFPFFLRVLDNRSIKRKQKRALILFSTDFLTFVYRAQDFVQNSNQYGIPNFLRGFITRPDLEIKQYNFNVETLFSQIMQNYQTRIKVGFQKYSEFDNMSYEFNNMMDLFVKIFVNDIIRELKQSGKISALKPNELSGLKLRFMALNNYINEYNGYRAKISTFWGLNYTQNQIFIPMETLD